MVNELLWDYVLNNWPGHLSQAMCGEGVPLLLVHPVIWPHSAPAQMQNRRFSWCQFWVQTEETESGEWCKNCLVKWQWGKWNLEPASNSPNGEMFSYPTLWCLYLSQVFVLVAGSMPLLILINHLKAFFQGRLLAHRILCYWASVNQSHGVLGAESGILLFK